MYMYIGIEITNRCNANCPWCFAIKRHNSVSNSDRDGFMNVSTFRAVVDRLLEQNLIHQKTLINLYAIGEPFLNADILKMFEYLNEKNLKYGISTNGSVPVFFREGGDTLRNLSNLIISIPGFSQKSYDRVHGFKFEKIRKNIPKLIRNYRQCGFSGDARLVYHVYQFNISEVERAKQFALENDIDFYPYYAILYEYRYVRDYLDNKLPYDLLKKASNELFLYHIETAIDDRPMAYMCDFFNMLLIDIDCNLKTCCQIRKGDIGYSYGNIFDLSRNAIIERRTSQAICKDCQALGIDHYLSVYTPFDLSVRSGECEKGAGDLDQFMEILKKNKEKNLVLHGAGQFGLRAKSCLEREKVKVSYFADNNALKVGTELDGVEVIAPEEILTRCRNPLVLVTTINYRQVMGQLSQLKIDSAHYFPIEAYQ